MMITACYVLVLQRELLGIHARGLPIPDLYLETGILMNAMPLHL